MARKAVNGFSKLPRHHEEWTSEYRERKNMFSTIRGLYMGRPVHHNLFSIYCQGVVGLFRSHGLLSKHLQSFFNTTVYVLMFFKKNILDYVYFRKSVMIWNVKNTGFVFGLETSFPTPADMPMLLYISQEDQPVSSLNMYRFLHPPFEVPEKIKNYIFQFYYYYYYSLLSIPLRKSRFQVAGS